MHTTLMLIDSMEIFCLHVKKLLTKLKAFSLSCIELTCIQPLCVFVHFKNTSKIEYHSSTVQVVCDKAILSASELLVIASVPHL